MGKTDGTRAYYLFGLRIVGDFGATIALPAVAAAWFGTRLDAKWGSKPYALAACVFAALLVTAVIVRRKAVSYGKQYQQLITRHDRPADRR